MSRWSRDLADLFVDSLRVADAMISEADRLLSGLDGQPEEHADENPVKNRPGDSTTADAVSTWANRALRRATLPELGRPGPQGLMRDLIDAASTSRPADFDQRPWLLPASLPLAFAGLFTEQLLRSEALVRTQRAEVLPGFLHFVSKTWSDLPVYFTLQYGRLLEELRRRLEERPHDSDLRFVYASTLLECGLFREAAEQFESLPGGERRARHWALVARCRAGDFERAVEVGRTCVDVGGEATSRLWLHLACERACADEAGELTIFSRRPQIDGLFELEDVSSEVGLHKISGGRGTAVADFTGDGHLDLAIAGAHSGVSLYLNRGDGTFDDASAGSGLDESLYAFSLAAADYDNDGRIDLFATGLGFFDGQGLLFKNVGDGRFEDVTRDAGLDLWGPGFTASWIDYDGDGWLDLFVVNNLGGLFDRKTPNRLFKNNRDGTFSDVTLDAGLVTPWPSLGHCWGDFTNDGLPDLFISNFGRAQLFKNLGDGRFEDISRQAGVDRPAIGSVALAADVDHDGWLDIVQLTYSRPEDALHSLEHGMAPPGASPPRLWRNRGGESRFEPGFEGGFDEHGAEQGLVGAWGTMSANLGDLGNRGRWDLVLGNGDPSMDRFEPTVLYAQDGDGHFRDVSAAAGLPLWGKGHGVNLADLAGDGRLHLIVGHGGLYPGDLMRTTVHRPVGEIGGELGHYVNLRLVATRGHHQAMGARIRVEAGGRTQHLHVSPGSAFGWLPLEQHVGLGDAQKIDTLHIRWPGGHEQTLHDLAVDRTHEIVEDARGEETT